MNRALLSSRFLYACSCLSAAWARIAAALPWEWGVLLAFPLLAITLNPSLPFGNGGSCDPWYYFGHARYYPELVQARPNYDGERLPMILPGAIAHRFFKATDAERVLTLLRWYTCIGCVFFIVRRCRNTATAFLTALFAGCHSYFLGAVGWSYIDGFGITYYLATLAVTLKAAESARPLPWLIAAGSLFALQFYTYPLWAIFAPVFPILFILTSRSRPAFAKLMSALSLFSLGYALGFLLVTAIFAAIAQYTLGDPYFYRMSIDLIFRLGERSEWWNVDFQWVNLATWMIMPTAAFVGLLVYLPLHARRDTTFTLILVGNFVACFALFAYGTFVRRMTLFDFSYYANMLIPAMFLALGVSLFAVPDEVPRGTVISLGAAVAAVCVLPLLFRWNYYELKQTVALPLLVLAGVFAWRAWHPECNRAWLVLLYGFAVAQVVMVPDRASAPYWKSYNGPRLYDQVALGLDQVYEQTKFQNAFFWVHPDPMQMALLPACRHHGSYDRNYPKMDDGVKLTPGMTLVMATRDRADENAITAELSKRGLFASRTIRKLIHCHGTDYWLTFCTLSASSD